MGPWERAAVRSVRGIGSVTDLELLRRAGSLLYGTNWQRALARGLGPLHPHGARPSIDERTVRRWAAGDRPVPVWAWGAMASLLTVRRGELSDLGRSMRETARELFNRSEAT